MQGGAVGRGKGPGEVRVLWELLVCSNRGFPGEISVLCSLSSLLSWPQPRVPVPCSQQLCELKMLQVCCVSPLGRNYTLFLATDGFSPSELTPRCYYKAVGPAQVSAWGGSRSTMVCGNLLPAEMRPESCFCTLCPWCFRVGGCCPAGAWAGGVFLASVFFHKLPFLCVSVPWLRAAPRSPKQSQGKPRRHPRCAWGQM